MSVENVLRRDAARAEEAALTERMARAWIAIDTTDEWLHYADDRRFRLQRRVALINIRCWRRRLARGVARPEQRMLLETRLRADRLHMWALRLGRTYRELIGAGAALDDLRVVNLRDEAIGSARGSKVFNQLAEHFYYRQGGYWIDSLGRRWIRAYGGAAMPAPARSGVAP